MASKRTNKKINGIRNGQVPETEESIKLHRTSCDKLYRWSMWRMYLNEELSRVITARRGHLDRTNTINHVTSPYLNHPLGQQFGCQMKNMFTTNGYSSHTVDILSDNEFLVFGLPRVSIRKQAPENVAQLHRSLQEIHRQKLHNAEDAEKQITKLFDFVTSEKTDTKNDSVEQIAKINNANVKKERETESYQHVDGETQNAKSDIYLTKSENDLPLVSKSRLFWEKLANSKNEILDLRKDKPETKNNQEHAVISGEILQKQQKLLKKTIPKRTSKDLWRTLRERKTEILQMRERISENEKNVHNVSTPVKKNESKTSQLWGLLFHKKKELLQMKHGHKVSHVDSKSNHDQGKKGGQHIGLQKTNTNVPLPRSFEDSFQKELAEKLRKRRSYLSSTSTFVE